MRLTLTVGLVLCAPGWALAHEGHHPVIAYAPSAWDVATLLGLFVAAALYLRGSRRIRSGGGRVRPVERAAFWTGWAALVAAVAPWMDRAATLTLSSHMVQHELLMLVGAPLLIAGRPIVPWLWALPTAARQRVGGGLGSPLVHPLWTWLTAPMVAWALHGATVWVWHLPVLYEAAVASEAVHAVQHAMFVGTAVLFWWGLIYGRYGRAAYGASALYVFLTMVHTGVLGAFFALSTRPFYGVYQDRAALAGVDATVDQQLAGLYMWIPAGLILTVVGLILLVAWLAESERRAAA
jgi:putative membrane protein